MRKKLYRFIRSKDKNKFLNYLAETGTISRAAQKAGISRQAHYFWLKEDTDYAIAYEKAKKMAADLLEEEAFHRAVEGRDVEIYYKGEKVGTKKIYSDLLLTFLLKGAFPDKYKDRVLQENVGDGSSEINWEEGALEDERDEEEQDHDPIPAAETMADGDSSEPRDA